MLIILHYAGIGSRETPSDVLFKFQRIGYYLAKNRFILRSGGARGADVSFEIGCDNARGIKEIYLPWFKFENSDSNLYRISNDCYNMAKKYIPYWDNLNKGAQKLLARDCYQVLGYDLKTPSKFIVCYTKNGELKGGTSMAIKIAKDYNIPIFNFGEIDGEEKFVYYLKQIGLNK